jgi:hypothetical protein
MPLVYPGNTKDGIAMAEGQVYAVTHIGALKATFCVTAYTATMEQDYV